MKLATALLSVPRPEGYVHETIRSLEETGFFGHPESVRLRLVTGTMETGHLERYYAHPSKYLIDALSEEEALEFGFDVLGIKPRCAFGHFRAMRHLLSVEPLWDEALVCEDDVRFSMGWLEYLVRLVKEINESVGRSWMLTLYRVKHPRQRSMQEHFAKGDRWFRLPSNEEFWGTQAIVYSKEALRVMPEALLEGCIRRFVKPVDLTLGECAIKENVALLASVPSLVDHIGAKTTGQSEWFHQAECFFETVPGRAAP